MKSLAAFAIIGLLWFLGTFYGEARAQARCSVPADWGRLVTVFEGDFYRTPDQWLGVFEDGQGTIRITRLVCEETYRDHVPEEPPQSGLPVVR